MSENRFKLKESLVNKILEQGHRLRDSMVKSILENDPFYNDVVSSKVNDPHRTFSVKETDKVENKELLEAFLSGDYLTKSQEEAALETIRTLPPEEICETTQKQLKSKCSCSTCTAYYSDSLKCDLRRTQVCDNTTINGGISECVDLLKQADSLKVTLYNLSLNSLGLKKVGSSKTGLTETYFVEYSLPERFLKDKTKSKTDSGLESNTVRVCAKRTNSDVIALKHTSIHTISNLNATNSEDYNLIFNIRYKTQKKSEHLGVAKFKLSQLKESTTFTIAKSIPITLDEQSSISLGSLKVALQLGAGKLYFGEEFVGAYSHKFHTHLNNESNGERTLCDAVLHPQVETDVYIDEEHKQIPVVVETIKTFEPKTRLPRNIEEETPKIVHKVAVPNQDTPEELLFGFIYIPEAQLFMNYSPNSYIICRLFGQEESSVSRVVYDSSKPLYNFCQTVPLLYDDNLLLKLRENFMIIEFWNKSSGGDEVFGLTRLSLHQFYLGYRNITILKLLKRNKLPTIGSDCWEPIYSPDDELIGQVQVLTALGTEPQINNLEEERGFKKQIVKAKWLERPKQSINYLRDRAKVNRTRIIKTVQTEIKTSPVKRIDVGVQSDRMDNKEELSKAHDAILSFLKNFERPAPARVDNGTNTESTPSTNIQGTQQLRKTSDLLDNLQQALSIDSKPVVTLQPLRLQVKILSANQLPTHRRVRRKKSKSKPSIVNCPPNTYVTFEPYPGDPIEMTNVCYRQTAPKYDFEANVRIPFDFIANDEKRLIFKVWKKTTDETVDPNPETDVVLGFAALDTTVLALGMPSLLGWYKIVDFAGKCRGQINIHLTPLDEIPRSPRRSIFQLKGLSEAPEDSDAVLSGALKRKFSELDEITRRLRLRLSEIVSNDSDHSMDDVTDEFERDINELSIEDDFSHVNFDEEARKFNENFKSQREERRQLDTNPFQSKSQSSTDPVPAKSSSETSGLLIERSSSESTGKHRIDTLLEKLSLITPGVSQPFVHRYVSGCSLGSCEMQDIGDIFKDLDQQSRPNITASKSFDALQFEQLYAASVPSSSQSESVNTETASGGSDTSIITCLSDLRLNPDGEGTIEEKK